METMELEMEGGIENGIDSIELESESSVLFCFFKTVQGKYCYIQFLIQTFSESGLLSLAETKTLKINVK